MRTLARSVLVASLLLPFAASAHESRILEIDGTTYQVTVGSLNEPVAVDDKSGVDLTVSTVSSTGGLTPVLGLEASMKVELRADGEIRELPIETRYGMPGKYQVPFYPTVETSYAYRVKGPLGGHDIDLTYVCSSAGHVMGGDDHAMNQELSEGVTLVGMRGSFGCPKGKAELGFPRPSASIVSINEFDMFDAAALAISAAALVIASRSFRRR